MKNNVIKTLLVVFIALGCVYSSKNAILDFTILLLLIVYLFLEYKKNN